MTNDNISLKNPRYFPQIIQPKREAKNVFWSCQKQAFSSISDHRVKQKQPGVWLNLVPYEQKMWYLLPCPRATVPEDDWAWSGQQIRYISCRSLSLGWHVLRVCLLFYTDRQLAFNTELGGDRDLDVMKVEWGGLCKSTQTWVLTEIMTINNKSGHRCQEWPQNQKERRWQTVARSLTYYPVCQSSTATKSHTAKRANSTDNDRLA